MRSFAEDDKVHRIVGLFCLLTSVYMLIAFTSFLFTWQVDQSIVSGGNWINKLFDPKVIVENQLGKIGAMISYLFIHNWFGIPSFVFVAIFFLTGMRILFKIKLVPMKQALKYGLFGMLMTSVSLAYVFNDAYFFLGGSFGYHINLWLINILGSMGTGFMLGFLLLTFMVINFNLNFNFLLPSKDQGPIDEEGFNTVTDMEVNRPVEEPTIEQEEGLVIEQIEDKNEEPGETDAEPPAEEEKADTAEISESVDLDMEPSEVTEKESDLHIEETIGEDGVTFSVDTAIADDSAVEEEITPEMELEDFDPTLELSSYKFPPADLLDEHITDEVTVQKEELEANKDRIVETLGNYNIKISKIKATIGPTVTLYEIIPEAGVRISKIKNLEDDIALSLSALGIRIIAPIPGKGTIGIEVPNQNPQTVSMRSLIGSDKFEQTKMDLPMALGRTISNEIYIADLTKMPHVLVAGATGQGKSVGLNAMLISLIYKKHPSQLKLVLVDPKKVELTLFRKIERHFLAKLPDAEEPIITDTDKVIHTLKSMTNEMDQRYELLKNAATRNIKEYNAKFIARKLNPNDGHRFLPYIVLVIDEFADLIMTAGKEIETPIARLAQLARAIGMHLIIATQRPSVNIITGTIKANFPARIAFRVTSKIDSRTILDEGGADQLIGRGDMLLSTGSEILRLQCAFVDTPEVERVTEFIGNQRGYADAHLLPEYVEEVADGSGLVDLDDRDVLFEEAARTVVIHQQGSASLLQRRLKLGYNRAGRIVDQLEAAGIIGPFEGSKARQVLIPDEYSLEQFLNQSKSEDESNKEE